MSADKMKAFPHWVVWKYIEKNGKPTKVPFNPKTERPCDPTDDPSNFASYAYAREVYQNSPLDFEGIGFVFNDHNPFSGIDLDNPFKRRDGTTILQSDPDYAEAIDIRDSHYRIINEFASLTEWSPSGMGVHIYVEGKLPFPIHHGKIEVYGRERFFTYTGNSHGIPNWNLEGAQYKLESFASAIGLGRDAAQVQVLDGLQREDDTAIISKCQSRGTSDLFNRLWSGTDDSGYYSGSEADQALSNLIAFETDNLEQCERVFTLSPRYQVHRKKLHTRPDVLKRNARKAFDTKAEPVNFSKLADSVREFVHATPENHYNNPYAHLMGEPPPGLLGAIIDFFYRNAPRQITEVALASAFALMSGITGRAYNIGGLGLAQYVVLLASSGTGKESMSGNIATLMRFVAQSVPACDQFIGPSYIASAQAIAKELPKRPSMLAIFAEFGVVLNIMLDSRGNANNQQQRAMYLDLYGKNGGRNQLGRSVYSDSDKNTKTVIAPAFSKLGESVPGLFYEAMNHKTISEGYFPRLLIIEYKGPAVHFNEEANKAIPSPQLVDCLASLCATSLKVNQQIDNGGDAIQVKVDNETQALRTQLDTFTVGRQNESSNEAVKALWARVFVKTMKLAGIRAVGVNWNEPVITRPDFEWALAFALTDVYRLLARIDTGEIESTNTDGDRSRALATKIRHYFTLSPDRLKGYRIDPRFHAANIIPLSYFQTSLSTLKAFSSGPRAEKTRAINDTIAEFVKNDMLREVPTQDVEKIAASRAKCYVIGPQMPKEAV